MAEGSAQEVTGPTGKRTNYISWEEYFMSLAFVSGDRSKDNRTQVGACIVNARNRVVGLGYNGMPDGLPDDKFPWHSKKEKTNILDTKDPYVCHAEMNAIVNKNQADLSGCKMYVSLYPCNKCAQIIIQSGIKGVIYYSDKNLKNKDDPIGATEIMFKAAGVTCRKYEGSRKKVDISFESINEEK